MNDVDLLANIPGFRDFYPEVWNEINYILGKMRKISKKYGYEEYEGPSLELVELIEAKSGESIMKEIFSLKDRSDRRLLLRPEQTPTLARMLASEQQRFKKPIRWFSIPRLFRDETVQKGRLREFWQLNVDILGTEEITADAEVISVGIDIIRACGIEDNKFNMYVNHRELLNNFIESISDVDPERVIPLVDKKMTFLQEIVQEKLIEEGMDENDALESSLIFRRIINSQGEFRDKLLQVADDEVISYLDTYEELQRKIMQDKFIEVGLTKDSAMKLYQLISLNGKPKDVLKKLSVMNLPDSCQKAVEDLEDLSVYLNSFGVIDPVVYDISMARGLDYYTGIVFEAFDATGEIVRAILGGGRYGDLVEALGGQPLSGVGFGMGETVILELAKLNEAIPKDIGFTPDLYIAPIKKKPIPEAIKLTTRLRESFSVMCNPYDWKLRRHFENADDVNATLVILLGMRDLNKNEVSIRIVESGETLQLPYDDNLESELVKLIDKHGSQ